MKNDCKVVTGPRTRWAYVNVWEPKLTHDGKKMKYSLRLIIPKDDTATVRKVKQAMFAAYEEGANRLRGDDMEVPPFDSLQLPLLDGDDPGIRIQPEVYRGCWYINSNTDRAPRIVDENLEPVLTHSMVYSGVYGRVSVTFYAWRSGEKRGIACGLNNLQLIRAGEPLGTKSTAAEDFADLDEEE